jgi:hypothetical protein
VGRAICDSVKAHPTLEVLNLRGGFRVTSMARALLFLTSQIEKVVDMMKVNMTTHTLSLDSRYSEHELFRGTIVPYLETNRLETRIRAIQITRPIAYRAKVLGRALLAARTDANSFWMLLKGNDEVTFPPTTATTAAAVSLSITPATDADVSTADATAALAAATPTPAQKRNARH